MIYEYLSGNAINRYPFDDNCNLKSSGGFVLPNSVFLDMQFFYKITDEAYTVSLISLNNNSGAETIGLSFTVRAASGSLIETPASVTLLHSELAEKGTIVKETSNFIFKVVCGQGLLDIAAGATVTHTFSEADAKLLNAATVQPVPRVRSIKLYNNGTLFKTITEDNLTDIAFELEEGTNIGFDLLAERANITIAPGLGKGLYNPCGDDLVIKTINAIPPDGFGNFLFMTDGCYTSEKGYQDGMDFIDNYGLTVTNICTPKCTSEQMDNYAHYLNRVKDGMETIAQVATETANELKQQIEDYITSSALTKNKPYYKTAYTKFPSSSPTIFYFSVVIGLFNPTEEPIPLTISATTSGTILTTSIRYKSGENSSVLATPTFTGEVPCIGVGRFEYVVKGAVGTTTNFSGTLDGQAFADSITLT